MATRLAWPETLRAALKAYPGGISGLARRAGVGRSTIHAYLGRRGKRKRRVQPTIRQVRQLASKLGVRPEFLFTGEEPMAADGWTAGMRALAQVDGVQADWDRPTTAETAAEAAVFYEAFEQGRKGRKVEYRYLSPTVRILFENLLARVMNCYKLAGRGEDVAKPAWRGERAAAMLDWYEREASLSFDPRPESTRRWLVALAGDMERFENNAAAVAVDPFP